MASDMASLENFFEAPEVTVGGSKMLLVLVSLYLHDVFIPQFQYKTLAIKHL